MFNKQTIPSGSAKMDDVLGTGGYPRGRVVEIFGPQASGKTTLSLHAIASCQEAGGVAAFVDAEYAFDPGHARSIGVNLDNMLISQPESTGQTLEITETLARSGAVDLVVVDSGPDPVSFERPDPNARQWARALRKITAVAHRTGCVVLFLTPGENGRNALKFYATIRMSIQRDGDKVSIRTVKNKMAEPFRAAEDIWQED